MARSGARPPHFRQGLLKYKAPGQSRSQYSLLCARSHAMCAVCVGPRVLPHNQELLGHEAPGQCGTPHLRLQREGLSGGQLLVGAGPLAEAEEEAYQRQLHVGVGLRVLVWRKEYPAASNVQGKR